MVTDGTAGGLQQGGFRVHVHRFRGLPEHKSDVEPGLVAQAESEAGLTVRAKAGLLDEQFVVPGGQAEQVVGALRVRHFTETRAGAGFRGGYLRGGHSETGRIQHGAEQFGLAGLSETGRRKDQQRGEHGRRSHRNHVL